MERNANFQTVAWFWDLFTRGLLEMEPPYQRRSVWNQEYKDYFVDTVLNGYPAPAIFLYQDISPDGVTKYSVVDGKQRLSTLFEFIKGEFPVSESATVTRLRGRYFKDLDDEVKRSIWRYQFSVEYLPSTDEKIINNIFDRINRNVAKLTPQELRHARFDGEFISEAESLSGWMLQILPPNFPSIVERSRKQMKDVELTAHLLLLLEEGPKSYSQDDLDTAFSERDLVWAAKEDVVGLFRDVVEVLRQLTKENATGAALSRSRLKNQADFYSLFGAIAEIRRNGIQISIDEMASHLSDFVRIVESAEERAKVESAQRYYEAARSASNDAGPRRTRIEIMTSVLRGELRGR